MNSAPVDCKVYRLPPEILEEIFFQCIPSFPSHSYKTAPLILCLVCSSWRDTMLQSSRLWSRVTIDMMDLASNPPPANPVIKFLGRSRNYPLSIQLTAASLPSMFDHSEWKSQFNSVLGQVHSRIRELRLSSPWLSKFLYTLDPNIQFPQLSSITVTSSGGSPFDSLPIPLNVFTHSPLLKRLDYAAYISYDTALNLAVPWAQLTHITLADIDFDSWNYIFPRCINMRSGSFVISGSSPRSPQLKTEITFTSLTCLAIHSTQPSRTPLSLEGFSFPNLRELTLEWNRSPGFNTNFLSTINHLEKLTISSAMSHSINMAEVLSVLSLTPFISHLRVLNDHCRSELFEALTYHACQQRPLLPRLRVLEVEAMHNEEAVLGALRKMLSSRRWIFPNSRVRQLEILRMSLGKHITLGVEEALQHLTSAGLLLEFYPAATATTRTKSDSCASSFSNF